MVKEKMDENEADGPPSFEDDLDRLEEIVRTLESGDLPLDEAISLYEEGVTLSKRCGEKLDLAEATIERLVEREGEIVKEPLDVETGSRDEEE